MWIKAVELLRQNLVADYLSFCFAKKFQAIRRRPIEPGQAIATAIVGLGRHARLRLAPALRDMPGFSLKAGVVRRRIQDMTPHLHVTARLDDVLADPDIRAAVVAAPASILAQIAARCLDAGLHVYCECPGAMSCGDIRALDQAQASAPHRLVFQVGYHFRSTPEIQAMAARIRGGRMDAWNLTITFHSLYHLADLVQFLAGRDAIQSVKASGRDEFCLGASGGRTILLRLKPGPLTLEASFGGNVTVQDPNAKEFYLNMFQDFESAIRSGTSPVSPIADLAGSFSIYNSLRQARLLARIFPV